MALAGLFCPFLSSSSAYPRTLPSNLRSVASVDKPTHAAVWKRFGGRTRLAFTFCVWFILSGSFCGYAQNQPNIQSGFQSYGSYDASKFESVSLSNGALSVRIPLPLAYPQRGRITPEYYLVVNSKAWQVHTSPNPETGVNYFWDWGPPIGSSDLARPLTSPLGAFITDTTNVTFYRVLSGSYDSQSGAYTIGASNYELQGWDGTVNQLQDVSGGQGTLFESSDLSGFQIVPSDIDPTYHVPDQYTITDRKGTVYQLNPIGFVYCTPPKDNGTIYSCYASQPMRVDAPTDANGNEYNQPKSAPLDTLGRSVPTLPTPPQAQECVTNYFSYTGPNGTAENIGACFEAVSLSTDFGETIGQQAVVEFPSSALGESGTVYLMNSVTLPNGTNWQLTYNSYGDIASITMPTKGTLTYKWTTISIPSCGDYTQMSRAVSSRTFTDGYGHSNTWQYTWGTWSGGMVTNTVTDPLGNDTVHVFTSLGGASTCSPYETATQYWSGSSTSGAGTLMKEVATTYQYGGGNDSSLPVIGYAVPTQVVTTDSLSGEVMQVTKQYDPGYGSGTPIFGNVTNETDYDWGSGSPGSVLKETNTTYEFQNNSNYLTANMPDLKASVVVLNGSGYKCSETDYTYDNSSYLTSSNITTQHGTPPGIVRGNLSSTAQQLSSTPCQASSTWSPVTSYTNMYDTGGVYQSIDPLGHTTTYNYSATYAGAYPTTVTNALSQSSTYGYDFSTGLMTGYTDPNQLTTSYTYDSMFRLSTVTNPDGGQDSVAYQESQFPFYATLTTQINSSQNKTEKNIFDGLARVTEHQLTSDPQGTVYTDTAYDALGRIATVSNPYRTGTDASTSTGTTIYGYDALSRKISETYPDTSVLKTAYCGPTTLVTDPTLRWRRSTVNGLGQLVEVDEPKAVGAVVNSDGCPGTSDPIWVTSYTNDPLGNLDKIVQNGSRTRTFTYDGLSRLLTATNPESGKVTYTYNADNTVATKTDARSIKATYSYDSIRRVTGVTYSNGDPSLSYTYDQANCLGLSACQNIGHRTSMTDGSGSEAWAYEVDKTNLRSIHQEQRTTISSPANITKTTTYYLDLAGGVTQLVYPTGRTVNYTYDSADRPSTAADASNGITYATGWQTPPANTNCTAGAVCYTPQGTVYGMSLGQSSTFTGLNFFEDFNNRLQPSEITASSSAGSAINITYNFVDPVSNGNAGHVYGISNNLNSARSQAFTYDQLNRVVSAYTSATTGSYCWGYKYTIDAWGNLTAQAGLSAYSGCSQYTSSATATAKNQLEGFTYDDSGNTLSDGTNSYQWDAESQLTTASGATYGYDGDGRRAAKAGNELYWHGSGGEVLAETDTAGNTLNEYIFFGGKRVAVLPASASPLYYAEDMLGTSRVIVQSDGTLCYDADFTPFGAELAYTSDCAQNYKFEGKERDSETGNDNFGARYYSWHFGRWLSADWSSKPTPVPYANLTNPQTLNLYAMVADDPESFADLDGHLPFYGMFSTGGAMGTPQSSQTTQQTQTQTQQNSNQSNQNEAQNNEINTKPPTADPAGTRTDPKLNPQPKTDSSKQPSPQTTCTTNCHVTVAVQHGVMQVDNKGTVSVVVPPAVAVNVNVNLHGATPDQTLLATPSVGLGKFVAIGTDVVKDTNGVHDQGGSISIGASWPPWPASVSSPASNFTPSGENWQVGIAPDPW